MACFAWPALARELPTTSRAGKSGVTPQGRFIDALCYSFTVSPAARRGAVGCFCLAKSHREL